LLINVAIFTLFSSPHSCILQRGLLKYLSWF